MVTCGILVLCRIVSWLKSGLCPGTALPSRDLPVLASMLMAPSEVLGLPGGSAAAHMLLAEMCPAPIWPECSSTLLPLGISGLVPSGCSCLWPSIRLLTYNPNLPFMGGLSCCLLLLEVTNHAAGSTDQLVDT